MSPGEAHADNLSCAFCRRGLLVEEVSQKPAHRMTAEERRSEVALLIARGLVRLREANVAREAGLSLGFVPDQRVHVNPDITQEGS
jgi:hypothetical protein